MQTEQRPTIVIHAGGKNSRFFPLNTETNKGFVTLLGKPLVVRALENLQKHGFTKVVLVVSEKDLDGKGLSGILGDYNLNLDITWVLQPDAHGQGHALLVASEYIDKYFISMSPYYSNAGELAEKLCTAQLEEQSDCVFIGTRVDDPSLYGMLAFDPDNPKRVVGIVEKPTEHAPSNYKTNSVYLLSKDFLNHLSQVPLAEYSLETALTHYSKENKITWIENTQDLPSLKYSWHLFTMAQYLFKSLPTRIDPNAVISSTAILDDSKGPIVIEAGAQVGDYAKIVGPCYIGAKSLVGDYSFVRSNSVLESGVTVGANTEVVRSIILTGASIHFGYLSDSILGQGVKVGAGFITANKRFDRKTIRTLVKGKMVFMSSNTHGAIIGAHTHVGIGTRTLPGILIGANNTIKPGTVVEKNIPHSAE